MNHRLISEPSAVIGGGAAWLISRILTSPKVTRLLNHPPAGVQRDDVQAAVQALHLAGKAFDASPAALERGETATLGAVAAECDLTTKEAAEYLRISVRRTQELAPELSGTRSGRQWRLPAAAVRSYERKKAERVA